MRTSLIATYSQKKIEVIYKPKLVPSRSYHILRVEFSYLVKFL